MALGIRDIRLGRLKLVSAYDDISESIAAQLEAVGATAMPGERQPRGLNVSFPLYGADADTDPYAQAARHRRQLRALLANRQAVMQGLYFAWVADPELNGWLLVGGGDISYEDGGVTLGDFKASLESVYKVGAQRTHRPGRRIELYDRRLSTTPRDYLKQLYSVDFAAQTALALNFLPLAVSDALGTGRAVPIALNRALRDGNVQYLVGRPHGDAVTFEQAEADQNKGDVLVFDRRGVTAPAETLAGSSDPQGVYGWEEVYGPDQPLTAGDVPVLDNGLVRVRLAANDSFALDQWVAGTGWVERGRVTVWRDYPAGTLLQFTSFVSAAVLEWTPEYAALRVVYKRGDGPSRVEIVITLGRGWTGPRVEAYGSWEIAGKPGIAVLYSPYDAGSAAVLSSTGVDDSSLGGWPFSGDFALSNYVEPWLALQPLAAGQPMVTLAFLQSGPSLLRRDDTTAYGSLRKALGIRAGYGTASAGYASVTFGIGSPGSLFEAETYRYVSSGTATQVADGAASGGQTVQETQAAENQNTLKIDDVGVARGITPGKYAVWMRARVGTAGATGTIKGYISTGGGAFSTFGTGTLTSTTYVWVLVGEMPLLTVADDMLVNAWRSAGAGNVYVDKVAFTPVERRGVGSETYDGARDVAQANLYDARSVPILAAR